MKTKNNTQHHCHHCNTPHPLHSYTQAPRRRLQGSLAIAIAALCQ